MSKVLHKRTVANKPFESLTVQIFAEKQFFNSAKTTREKITESHPTHYIVQLSSKNPLNSASNKQVHLQSIDENAKKHVFRFFFGKFFAKTTPKKQRSLLRYTIFFSYHQRFSSSRFSTNQSAFKLQ